MFSDTKISPSILSVNALDMRSALEMMENAGTDWIHVDVMDGHFVPNLTMGVPMVKALNEATDIPLDVHLMIENPLTQIPWFLDAGADIVTFHIEATNDEEASRAISLIHEAGALAGIALKPKTDIESVRPYINDVDMVLIMSVEPGFSGQSYIEGSDDRVSAISVMIKDAGRMDSAPLIQVDGGMADATVKLVATTGADVIVSGNTIFKSDDPAQTISSLREASDSAHKSSNHVCAISRV